MVKVMIDQIILKEIVVFQDNIWQELHKSQETTISTNYNHN